MRASSGSSGASSALRLSGGTPWRTIGDRSIAPKAWVSVESDAPRPSAMQSVIQTADFQPKHLDLVSSGSAPGCITVGPRALPVGIHKLPECDGI
jgi:hypothetical protein